MKKTGWVSAAGFAVQSAAVGQSGLAPGPDRVRQRERHDRLDQGRVVGGGPDRTAGALGGADRGHLADVQVAVEDAGRDAVLGDQVVRGGVDLVAAARVGQGRGDDGEPVRGEVAQEDRHLAGVRSGPVAPGHDRAVEAERGVVARVEQVVDRGAGGVGHRARGRGVGSWRRERGLHRVGRGGLAGPRGLAGLSGLAGGPGQRGQQQRAGHRRGDARPAGRRQAAGADG